MTGGLQFIPDCRTGMALEDNEEHCNQVEYENAPNIDLDSNEHLKIGSPGGIEYP